MSLPADIHRRMLPIALAQGVGIACGIIGVRLGSHMVSPSDYGRYGVFMTMAPVGIWVVFAGLNKLVSREWAATHDRAGFLAQLARSVGRRLPWLAALAAGLTICAAPPHPFWFGTAVLFASLALALTQFAQSALQADRLNWLDCGFVTVASLTRTFLPLAAYAFLGAAAEQLIGGFVLHSLLLAALGFAWLSRYRHRLAPAEPGPVWSSAFTGPMFTALALAGWGLSGLTRWLAAGFYGTETAGYVTLAVNIAAIIPSVLGTMLLQYFQPGWFALGDAGAGFIRLKRATDRVAAGYAAGALTLSLLLHLLMPLLVGPLVGERYAAAAGLILPLGCFATAIMTGTFFHALLLALRREQACGPAELTGAATLAGGALAGAWLGWDWFLGWLTISPIVPWVINRPLALRALGKASEKPQ